MFLIAIVLVLRYNTFISGAVAYLLVSLTITVLAYFWDWFTARRMLAALGTALVVVYIT